MAKTTKPRWSSDKEEGEALLNTFTSGEFDLWTHYVNRLKISHPAFNKFDMAQFKNVIRRLQDKVNEKGGGRWKPIRLV